MVRIKTYIQLPAVHTTIQVLLNVAIETPYGFITLEMARARHTLLNRIGQALDKKNNVGSPGSGPRFGESVPN